MIPGFVGHVQYEDGSTAFHGPLQVGEISDAVTTPPGASFQPSPSAKALIWLGLVGSTIACGYLILTAGRASESDDE